MPPPQAGTGRWPRARKAEQKLGSWTFPSKANSGLPTNPWDTISEMLTDLKFSTGPVPHRQYCQSHSTRSEAYSDIGTGVDIDLPKRNFILRMTFGPWE